MAADRVDGALAAALDRARDCVTLLDGEGLVRYANQAIASLHRHDTADTLLGRSWVDQWDHHDRADIADALAASHAGSTSRLTICRSVNDDPRWIDIWITDCSQGSDPMPGHLVIARDITAEMADRERREAVGAEMAHRLKNAMTVAAGLTSLSARGHADRQAFAQELTERFSQLAMVQGLVLSERPALSLAQIVPMLAAVYGGASTLEFGILPDVHLSNMAMQALALAFGELATNSLKYGALKTGKPIRISAEAVDHDLYVTWYEDTVFAATRDGGQGIGLIERIVQANGGTFSQVRGAQQLVARLSVPILDAP